MALRDGHTTLISLAISVVRSCIIVALGPYRGVWCPNVMRAFFFAPALVFSCVQNGR
jgi:hypothetical protein